GSNAHHDFERGIETPSVSNGSTSQWRANSMKRRKNKLTRKTVSRFPMLRSANWDIRRRVPHEHALEILVAAVETARELGLARAFDDLDKILTIAEPWVDRDILRAHILSDGDPAPGTKFVIAFVRGDGEAIEATRWYILPPARSGALNLRIVAIGLDEDQYGLLMSEGWEAFFSLVLTRLRDSGYGPRD